MNVRTRIALAAGLLPLLGSPVQAGSWRVGCLQTDCDPPCNFFGPSGIADCMVSLDVLPGDTVTVWPSLSCDYNSAVTIKTGILLRSFAGPEQTVLRGSAAGTPAIFFVGTNPGTRVEGFTFTWDAGENSLGGGVGAYVASGVLRNNWFVSSAASVGSAIYLQSSDLLVENNLFLTNNTTAGGGAVAISGGDPVLRNNTFTGNFSPFGYEGAALYAAGSDFTFDRNIVHGSMGAPAVFCGGGNLPSLSCNIFWANQLGAFAGQCADSVGTSGNIAADPLFCNAAGLDFGFCADSPALTGACGAIGYASPTGNCGPCMPTHVAVTLESMPWGRVKSLYR